MTGNEESFLQATRQRKMSKIHFKASVLCRKKVHCKGDSKDERVQVPGW